MEGKIDQLDGGSESESFDDGQDEAASPSKGKQESQEPKTPPVTRSNIKKKKKKSPKKTLESGDLIRSDLEAFHIISQAVDFLKICTFNLRTYVAAVTLTQSTRDIEAAPPPPGSLTIPLYAEFGMTYVKDCVVTGVSAMKILRIHLDNIKGRPCHKSLKEESPSYRALRKAARMLSEEPIKTFINMELFTAIAKKQQTPPLPSKEQLSELVTADEFLQLLAEGVEGQRGFLYARREASRLLQEGARRWPEYKAMLADLCPSPADQVTIASGASEEEKPVSALTTIFEESDPQEKDHGIPNTEAEV